MLRETNLNDLYVKARALYSNAVSIAELFDDETSRLIRMKMEAQLRDLHSQIVKQLHMTKAEEDVLKCSYNQNDTVFSLTKLAAGGIIKMVSKNNEPLSAIGDQLLKKPARSHPDFGLVLVGIGPVGVPDGVQVVAVSQLARESNRAEAEVTNELKKQGQFLFNEQNFSLLIDKLIEGVREGSLTLPVSAKKLPRIKLKAYRRLEGKKVE